jgi:hypothetical protein
MNLTICTKLCNECPFSVNALKGWLGPHTIDAVIDTQDNEGLFSCHLARKENMTVDEIESGAVRMCRGYIASSTKSGIEFGDNQKYGKELRRLQLQVIAEDLENNDIILSQSEFKEHHGRIDVAKRLSISREELLRRQGLLRPTATD